MNGEYLYDCDTCPFVTSDADSKRGHETGIAGGWLGRNETHKMRVRDTHARTDEMIAMVEVNVRSMTDTFLRNSWEVAYNRSVNAKGADRQRFWDTVRDIYGSELDRRDRERDCEVPMCHAPACAITPNNVRVCSGHSDLRWDRML